MNEQMRMNKEHKIKNLQVNGSTLENNEDKAVAFAKCFSDISSKNNIELNHKIYLLILSCHQITNLFKT